MSAPLTVSVLLFFLVLFNMNLSANSQTTSECQTCLELESKLRALLTYPFSQLPDDLEIQLCKDATQPYECFRFLSIYGRALVRRLAKHQNAICSRMLSLEAMLMNQPLPICPVDSSSSYNDKPPVLASSHANSANAPATPKGDTLPSSNEFKVSIQLAITMVSSKDSTTVIGVISQSQMAEVDGQVAADSGLVLVDIVSLDGDISAPPQPFSGLILESNVPVSFLSMDDPNQKSEEDTTFETENHSSMQFCIGTWCFIPSQSLRCFFLSIFGLLLLCLCPVDHEEEYVNDDANGPQVKLAPSQVVLQVFPPDIAKYEVLPLDSKQMVVA